MFLKIVVVSFVFASSAVSGSEVEVIKSAVTDWLECGFAEQPTNCLEERTVRSLHELNLNFMGSISQVSDRAGKVLNDTSASQQQDPLSQENQDLLRKIQERKGESRGIVDEIGDLFTSITFKFLDPFTGEEDSSDNTVEQDDEDAPLEERGHKKKELKKKNKQLKLILLLMLLKNKIKMFVNKLQFLVQLKFLLVATVNMLANVIRLWIEIKKKHKPNKVVYYENAHHQHHYDHEHVHDDDHHYSSGGRPLPFTHHSHHYEDDDEHGGGGIWPWSRSYAEKHGEHVFHRENPYGRYPGSHTIVYSNQRPLR